MKKTIELILFVGVLFVPAVFAQGSGSYEPAPQHPASAEQHRTESNFDVTRSTAGAIIGLKDGILTIKDNKNREISIGIVKRTKFRIGKKNIDPNELEDSMFKEGRNVKITYLPSLNKKLPVDKLAVLITFEVDKEPKEKPKLG